MPSRLAPRSSACSSSSCRSCALRLQAGTPGPVVPNVLALIGWLALLASLVMAVVPSAQRRAVHDLEAGRRVVRAATRRIDFQQDVRLLVPGRVDMVKRT